MRFTREGHCPVGLLSVPLPIEHSTALAINFTFIYILPLICKENVLIWQLKQFSFSLAPSLGVRFSVQKVTQRGPEYVASVAAGSALAFMSSGNDGK